MHTLAKNSEINERLIRFCLGKAYGQRPSIDDLTKDNIINGTQLSELAVSKISGIPLCDNGEHRDLIDNSDVKTATVQESYYTTKLVSGKKTKNVRYFGVITNVKSKLGMLRCIVFNPKTSNWHFFLIPPSAYRKVQNVKIAFDKDTQLPKGQYAVYEVENFEAVCRKKNLTEEFDELLCRAKEGEDLNDLIYDAITLHETGTLPMKQRNNG